MKDCDVLMNVNPIDKLNELCDLCKVWPVQVVDKRHDGYEWLEEDSCCIVVTNPYIDRTLEIKLENNGEFILFFANGHCHYYPDDVGFSDLCKYLTKLLENQLCAAAIFYGSNDKWLGDTYLSKEDIGKPYTEIFSFVLMYEEFRNKIYQQGGKVQYLFWNPKDDITILIDRQ